MLLLAKLLSDERQSFAASSIMLSGSAIPAIDLQSGMEIKLEIPNLGSVAFST